MLNNFWFYDIKAFPFSFLIGIFFFLGGYFATKDMSNGSTEDLVIAGAVVAVSALLWVFFLAVQNKVIANKAVEKIFGEEPISIGQSISLAKGNLPTIIGMTILLVIINTTVIPIIGTAAGGIFQVNVMDFEFNILTLLINIFLVCWYLIGLASVAVADASFIQTFSYTTEFFFDNFSKMIGFVFATILCSFIFSFAGVSLVKFSPTVAIPIKCLLFIYLFGFINSLAIHLFASYANFDEERDWDEEEIYDEEE